MGINENIRRIWLKTGMSQQELAEKINAKYPDDKISAAGVSKVMVGTSNNLTHKTMERIAYGLGVDVKDFFIEDDEIISSKLAIRRLDQLSPEVITALGDKSKYNYLLLGLSLAESDISPEELHHIIDVYRDLKKKITKA